MIREFTKNDLEQSAELYVQVFASLPWNEYWESEWAFERLETIYDSPGFLGCVSEENDNIHGVIIGRSNSFKGKRELEIVELFVSLSHQSKHVGSKLLSAVETKARISGYSHSTLLTSRTVPAFNFYVKNGFKASNNMVFMSHEL